MASVRRPGWRPLAPLLVVALVLLARSATCLEGAEDASMQKQAGGRPAPRPAAASNDTRRPAAGGPDSTPAGEDSLKFPLYMRLLATLACLVIFTIGVCGNLLVPLVVIKTKYLRNSTNLFLINLSVADLLVLIVCMPTVLIELHSRPETWLLGEAMCKYTSPVCPATPIDLLRAGHTCDLIVGRAAFAWHSSLPARRPSARRAKTANCLGARLK